ncbi:hypothetical protein AUJ46_04685 [Candidatus Peregrinibacteria bacterium CG1_02_54_53]|nr:MAG: hypothetical protein AUJ46_04685 [Candidatus Peregrinibacteria bacterium CG1_02_54_53]
MTLDETLGDELWERLNDVMTAVSCVGIDACMHDSVFPNNDRDALVRETHEMETQLVNQTQQGPPSPDRRPALTDLLINTEHRIREICEQHHVDLSELIRKHRLLT